MTGIPYAYREADAEGLYLVCPVCGAKCRAEPLTIELTHEDRVTKGAAAVYARHYKAVHGEG